MPKIIQYKPNQVPSQAVAQPKASGNVPAAAFGAPIAQGLADVAKATWDIKTRVDTTSAEDALNSFEKEKNELFFNPEGGYFNAEGKNAYDRSIETQQTLDKIRKKYADTLNPEARMMFDKVAQQHITKANAQIAQHASKGLRAWEVATIESGVKLSIENASLNWSDPEAVRIQMAKGELGIHDAAAITGESPETTNQKLKDFRSTVATAVIEAATYSSAKEGKDLLEKYDDMKIMEGTDKLKMLKMIKTKEDQEKTKNDATLAVLTGSRLVDEYPDDRESALAEIKKIEDPELRAKTLSAYTTQFTAAKTAKKEAELEHYNTAIALVNDGRSPTEIQAMNPEAWHGMSDLQRNNILSGKLMTTDQIKLQSLLSLPRDQLAKIEPAQYAGTFRPADVNKLRSAVDQAKKGQNITSVQTPAQKINGIAEQFFGKKKGWSKAKTEKINSFMEAAQSEIEQAEVDKGGKLTPSEIDKILNDYSRAFVAERSLAGIDYFWPDRELDLKNTPPEQVAALNKLVDTLGEAKMQQVVKYLDDNNIPINAVTIINAARQASGE